MLLNRRRGLVDRRRPYKRAAKIKYHPGSLPRDCIITEVSERGAKIVTEDDDIPVEFTIIFSTGHSHQCQLRWRTGNELGVKFTDYFRRRQRRRRKILAK